MVQNADVAQLWGLRQDRCRSSSGNTVTENVTINVQGQTMRNEADTASLVSDTPKHVLTWIKSGSGKWLLAKDDITRDQSMYVLSLTRNRRSGRRPGESY